MKKFIIMFTGALALAIAQPVYANDGPPGSAPGGPAAQAPAAAQSGSDIGTWILLALLALGAVGIITYIFKRKLAKQDKQHEERSTNNARELARISSTLLAALIALMTFLLVVGIQNSIKGFTTELYTALILLGTGLVLYAIGNVIREAAIKGGSKTAKLLSIMRGLQQLVFVGSIVAVVWFVINYAQLVIKPPVAPPSPGASQQQPPQPSGQQPSAPEQAPTETQLPPAQP